ncbi:short chain dehydrogenase [Marinobacterium jannaschii]|uniref:short chain dehydrogenase n=1 Tax=Marinobacterium jannaschii TaxID=64970 RepID=UPI000485EC55|nr:short chain dehydrogenase [Marinobacterium jannaschii]
MKILVIGATGTIGKAVVENLSADHQVISAGYSDGDVKIDLGSAESIRAALQQLAPLDAIISTAGLANFGPFAALKDEDFQLALDNKLMGQVNLVRIGREFLADNGSVILTSGILSRQPLPGSSSISMVNGALESFARAVALEEQRIRVNVVAPAFVKETMEMMGMDSSQGVSAVETASHYRRALESGLNGQTFDVQAVA